MKRRAAYELNEDNWDKPEIDKPVIQDSKIASEEVLKKRVILKAKRSSLNQDVQTKVNPFSSKMSDYKQELLKTPPKTSNAAPIAPKTPMDDKTKDEKFSRAVAKLNSKFVKSVTDFVKSNSCVDLQPCFDSYNKLFMQIVKTYGTDSVVQMIHNTGCRDMSKMLPQVVDELVITKRQKSGEDETTKVSEKQVLEPNKETGFDFSKSKQVKNEDKVDAKPFAFLSNPPKPSTTPFTFGSNSTEAKPSFSFGQKDESKPKSNFAFSFKPSSKPKSEEKVESNENDPSDNVPTIIEKKFETENVVYEARCKLYYMGETGYKERGVGNCYIKKDPETNKGQIIVRAENTSGTVLLNSCLPVGMAVTKQGKNNILIMTIVSPAIPGMDHLTGKMSSFLMKLKGETITDQAVSEIEKFTKQ